MMQTKALETEDHGGVLYIVHGLHIQETWRHSVELTSTQPGEQIFKGSKATRQTQRKKKINPLLLNTKALSLIKVILAPQITGDWGNTWGRISTTVSCSSIFSYASTTMERTLCSKSEECGHSSTITANCNS